jgi:hypothetical protein
LTETVGAANLQGNNVARIDREVTAHDRRSAVSEIDSAAALNAHLTVAEIEERVLFRFDDGTNDAGIRARRADIVCGIDLSTDRRGRDGDECGRQNEGGRK